MRLTLRDLFWLVLLVAAVTAWWVEQVRVTRAVWQRHRYVIGSERDHPNFHKRELTLRAALDEFAQMTDAELDEYLGFLPASKYFQLGENHYAKCDEYEPCLDEMARRRMAVELQEHYDALMAPTGGKPGIDFPANLELLTALRRAQGKPDPLEIQLKLEGSLTGFGKFQQPWFSATIENVDVDSEAVGFEQGGDYRGGRLDKWRFELLDEQGRAVGGLFLSGGGSGIFVRSSLQYGEKSSWDYTFDLRSYLAPPPPGKYRLRALYHNDEQISGLQNVDGLIVTKSEPIPVVIRSRPRLDGKRPWIEMPMPLAVLVGCVMVTLASIGRSEWGSGGITRRDFRWGLVIAVLAIGMWLSDGWLTGTQDQRYRRFDMGDWSIRLVEGQ